MALYPDIVPQALDNDGQPISGAGLYFYESGTTTPLDTFSEESLSSANANPVVADAAGRFGPIYLSSENYKVVLKDAGGVTIWSRDPISGINLFSTAEGINDTATGERLRITDAKIAAEAPAMIGDLTAVILAQLLHLRAGTAGTITPPADADELVIEDDADAGMSFFTPDADEATINFGSDTDDSYASIKAAFNADDPYIRFMFGAVEVLRILESDPLAFINDWAGAAKAWVQFNGTGTIAIDASHNVDSISDGGTGQYTVNWDTDFASVDYCVTLSCDVAQSGERAIVGERATNLKTAGALHINVVNSVDNALIDTVSVYVAAFGSQ